MRFFLQLVLILIILTATPAAADKNADIENLNLFVHWTAAMPMVDLLPLNHLYLVEAEIERRCREKLISARYAESLKDRVKKEIALWEKPLADDWWKEIEPLWKKAAAADIKFDTIDEKKEIAKRVDRLIWCEGKETKIYLNVLRCEMNYFSRPDHRVKLGAIVTDDRLIVSGPQRIECVNYPADETGMLDCLIEVFADTPLDVYRKAKANLSESQDIFMRSVVLAEQKDDPARKKFVTMLEGGIKKTKSTKNEAKKAK